MTVGERVKVMREAQGLSQQDLAGRAKVVRATIESIEQAADYSPRLDTLQRVADALGVHIGALIGIAEGLEDDLVRDIASTVALMPQDKRRVVADVARAMLFTVAMTRRSRPKVGAVA